MKAALDFLEIIVATKQARLKEAEYLAPLAQLRNGAYQVRSNSRSHSFNAALANDGINVIAEIKRASPSKGSFDCVRSAGDLAAAYARAGAAAVSVLTEEDYFHGSLNDLIAARDAMSLPLLRKDFIFDEYQIYESAAAGADALLLIAALLHDDQLLRLRTIAEDELKMDALVEVHSVDEMRRAIDLGARTIGVNNRNLHTFEVSLDVSLELIRGRSTGVRLISESGLTTSVHLRQLRNVGYDGFLIGEVLITSKDAEQSLRRLIEEASK